MVPVIEGLSNISNDNDLFVIYFKKKSVLEEMSLRKSKMEFKSALINSIAFSTKIN